MAKVSNMPDKAKFGVIVKGGQRPSGSPQTLHLWGSRGENVWGMSLNILAFCGTNVLE